eukprot:1195638-Prorocentrum_minimum.AAC.3
MKSSDQTRVHRGEMTYMCTYIGNRGVCVEVRMSDGSRLNLMTVERMQEGIRAHWYKRYPSTRTYDPRSIIT